MRVEEWRTRSLRRLLADDFSGEWGTEPANGRGNVAVLRATDLDEGGGIDLSTAAQRTVPVSKAAAKRLRPGDILLEASGGGPGKPVGRVALFDGDGDQAYLSSNFFRTLRPRRSEVVPAYLARRLQLLYREPRIQRFQQQTTGITNLNVSDYLDVELTLPGLAEQEQVVEILDDIDAGIDDADTLVRKLRRLKDGLLEDLLAQGIADAGNLRPAEDQAQPGEVEPLAEAIESAVDGPFGSNLKSEHYVAQPGVRVVRLQNIGSGQFEDDDRAYVSSAHAATLSRHRVVPGDLLVASLGDDNHPVARACIYPDGAEAGIVKADCFRLRMKPERAENRFVMYTLNCPAMRTRLRGLAQGVTRDRVNLGSLKEFRLKLPPIAEQEAIVTVMRGAESRISVETEAAAKLRKIRKGLASDLLTGRVRAA
jgi:type I restriction enzyme S subunit